MQTAFLTVFAFPPPSPGADIFAQLDWTRWEFAFNAGIALMIQRIKRNLVLVRIVPKHPALPIENRIEFGDVAACIQLFKFNSLRVSDWLRRCPVSHAGALLQSAVERFNFADMAATAAQLGTVVRRGRTKLASNSAAVCRLG